MGIPNGFIGGTELARVTSVTNSQIAAANKFLDELTRAAKEIVPPTISLPPGSVTAPELAELSEFTSNAQRPGDIDFGEISPLPDMGSEVTFPISALEPPEITVVTPPTFSPGPLPDAPVITNIGLPGAPAITLPPAPELLRLDVRSFEGVTMPTFDGGPLPEVVLVEPSVTPYVPGSQYTSALLTSLKAELQRRIDEGGTGLKADIEQAIWDRARERELKAVQDAIDGLERMETMGFAFPPGVYLDARLKIETEYGKTQAGLSRDIAIKQAELELANVQDALKNAIQLEAQLMEETSRMEQRLFEAARYTTEAGVQIYNAKVEAYKSLLDAYRTKVTIYEALIRGEIAKVEAYKAEIAAEQAKAEVNSALVQQYRVRVDAALAGVELYRVQVQAAQAAVQMEQNKVALYGEQVRAYATKANMYTAEVEGYKARMQVEAIKQDAYKSQVQAYGYQVEAAAKQAEVQIEQYKASVAAYSAQFDGLRAKASVIAAQMQGYAAELGAEADLYRANAQAVASANEVLVKKQELAIKEVQGAQEVAIAQAKMTGELSISSRQLVLEASKVAAQVAAQLGAAALNAFNWSNSVSSSETFSSSISTSTSTSTSTNTNYNL